MKTTMLMLLVIGTVTTGCATINCPEGSLPVFGQNIDQACKGNVGLKLLDKEGNVAGECRSSGPKVGMCVKSDWCGDGNQTITTEKIACERDPGAADVKKKLK